MSDTVSRILNIKKEELPLALLSVAYFFCVLCGYYFLRPVREAMGISRGMDELRWLFVGTALVSLVLVLAFGGVVARTNRRRFIPIAFGGIGEVRVLAKRFARVNIGEVDFDKRQSNGQQRVAQYNTGVRESARIDENEPCAVAG